MDVTLDANIYLADPRMESVSFRSLLDYLRKTQSTLVIPKPVLEEVSVRYIERLLSPASRAASFIKNLNNLLFVAEVDKLPEIDFRREERALRSKLLKPSKYVKSKLLSSYGDVDVAEIVRRGVHRVPPANGNGEELRDVITWLMMLSDLSKSKRNLAFISSDEHFGSSNSLRPQLQEDIAKNNVEVHFYSTIDDFIKAHALAPKPLVADNAIELIGIKRIEKHFEAAAHQAYQNWTQAKSYEIRTRDVRFVRGALYDVGVDSQYGEVEFEGDLTIQLTLEQHSYIPVGYPTNIVPPLLGPTLLSPWGTTFMGDVSVSGMNTKGAFTLGSLLKPGYVPWGMSGQGTIHHIAERKLVCKVSGTLVLALRLVGGKVTLVETEKFELTNSTENWEETNQVTSPTLET